MLRRIFFMVCLSAACSASATAGDQVAPVQNRSAVSDFNTCAKPVWPGESIRQAHTGTVTFRFLIAPDGHVADAVVTKSSGHLELDDATVVAVKKCTFVAAIKDGTPIASWMKMQYVWRFD